MTGRAKSLLLVTWLHI